MEWRPPETQKGFEWERNGAFRPACTRRFTPLKLLQHPEQKRAGTFCREAENTPLDKIPKHTEWDRILKLPSRGRARWSPSQRRWRRSQGSTVI